jgi:metal-sulfur cluster biosynthetic enzyme
MVAACTQPLLVGPPEQLQAVMQALDRDVIDPDTGRSVVDLQWVKSLRIENGESELTLTFEPACGAGKVMSEAAFHTLLRLQPDTDIYISHRS